MVNLPKLLMRAVLQYTGAYHTQLRRRIAARIPRAEGDCGGLNDDVPHFEAAASKV